MKWFKHMADASMNKKIQQLEARLGLKGYAMFFKTVELCAEQYDGRSGDPIFILNYVTLQNKLRTKRVSLQNYLRISSELNFWNAECSEYEVRLIFPKFLEIRHKDALSSGNRRESGGPKAGLDKSKSKSNTKARTRKPRGALTALAKHSDHLADVTHECQEAWIELYGAEFVSAEIQKAKTWLAAKGTHRKNFGLFITNWLGNSSGVTAAAPRPAKAEGTWFS